jgi:hypothetical protein
MKSEAPISRPNELKASETVLEISIVFVRPKNEGAALLGRAKGRTGDPGAPSSFAFQYAICSWTRSSVSRSLSQIE